MTLETLLSLAITLVVFSYVLGDNLLYRLAIYIFVGVTAGVSAIVIVESVIVPLLTRSTGNAILVILGFGLTLLLALRAIPLLRPLGNFTLAFLIAVGAAVAVIGAVTGTLLPIARSAANTSSGFVNGIVILVGIVTSLAYFQYAARRTPDGRVQRGAITRVFSTIGEVFVVITLGAVYGAALVSSLSVLTGHLGSLLGR